MGNTVSRASEELGYREWVAEIEEKEERNRTLRLENARLAIEDLRLKIGVADQLSRFLGAVNRENIRGILGDKLNEEITKLINQLSLL
jgi:hypothetical protein